MQICKCQNCTDQVPGGRAVSRSTYHRHAKQTSRKRPAMHQCICSDYPSGHFFRSKSVLYNHRRTLVRLGHEIPDPTIETGENFEDGMVFLYFSQLKIRI